MSSASDHSAAAPAWVAEMQAGCWYRVSGDNPDLGLPATAPGTRYLQDNDPARDPVLNPPRTVRESLRRAIGRRWLAPWSGRMGFAAITEAWNGAVYASGVGAAGAMIVFGGGHNTYFGSDVHAFDLASRQWRRLTDGFTAGRADDYGEGAVYPDSVYPDGSPLPPHTYGYIQYDEASNRLLLAKGQTELGPHVKAAAIPHLLELDTLTWQSGPRHPWAILNSGGFSTWDAGRRLLWVHSGDSGGGNAFTSFSPDGTNPDGSVGRWSMSFANKLPGEAEHNAMQIYPPADLIIVAIHSQDRLGAIDPKAPGDPIVPVESRGARPRIREFAALEYSKRMESLVYFSASDGAAVHAVTGERSMHWRVISAPDSMDPVADAATQSRYPTHRAHTFGRFRIARFDDCELAILVRHIDSPVYCLRLPS